MRENQEQEISINILELMRYLWKHAVLLAVVFIIGAGLSFSVSKFIIPPMYTSTSIVYVGGSGGTSSISGMLSMLQIGNALTADYQNLATSKPVVERLIDDFKLDTDYEKLSKRIKTNNPVSTRMLEFSVEDRDPDLAKNIVDDLTNIMIEQATEVLGTTAPTIVQEGDIPDEPSSPDLLTNTISGGLIALLVALAIMLSRFIKNNSLKSEEDIAEYLGLNNLGTIPLAESSADEKDSPENDTEKAGK